MKRRKPIRKHWYIQYLGECPACGRDKSWRERVYGRKPKDERRRCVQLSQKECYDHCIG